MPTLIAPSLLACDFNRVGEEVARCVEAGADVLHLDLMDGHFVPNLSFGFPIIEKLVREFPDLPMDVHLMVSNPQDYLGRLLDLGVWQISVHWEAAVHLHRLLGQIRDGGARAGVAFNPHTPVDSAKYLIDMIDCYLIMTVNPGFGGQSFLSSQLAKVEGPLPTRPEGMSWFVWTVGSTPGRDRIASRRERTYWWPVAISSRLPI